MEQEKQKEADPLFRSLFLRAQEVVDLMGVPPTSENEVKIAKANIGLNRVLAKIEKRYGFNKASKR
jgi:hypothetical protein